MRTITVWNMKGGVGKTTLSFNLAANLSRRGHRVLCIDLDAQANLTSFFEKGAEHRPRKDHICQLAQQHFSKIRRSIYKSKYENLDYIRGCNLETRIANIQDLWNGLALVGEIYDYCIIDCHPDFSHATQSALFGTDTVLVPILLDGFSRDNLNLVNRNITVIEQFREGTVCGEKLGTDISYYIIANRVANRKSQKEVYQDLVMRHDYPFIDVCISEGSAVQSANALHKPLYMHRKNATPTKDIEELTDILTHNEGVH